jgi:hypothetical protein
MARPRKPPGERKDYHLRVPLSDAQRSLVEEAARLDDQDKAAWARSVLLDAAKRRVEKARKSGSKSS